VIRAQNMLWPEGTRANRNQLAQMPVIHLNTPAMTGIGTTPGCGSFYLAGIAVYTHQMSYAPIRLGDNGANQDTYAEIPQNIILSRMVTVADSVNVRRCVATNSGMTAIVDSWFDDCHEKGSDSQALGGWNASGPFLIENNHAAGAGENIMFGGGDPSIKNMVPTDITIRKNHVFTPPAWRGTGGVTPWTKKNLIEMKVGIRVLIEDNVLDGSWTDGQTGWAILIRSANQDGGCNMCRSADVTMRHNLIRNVSAGINIIGDGGIDTTTRRVVAHENVLEIGKYPGDLRGFQTVGDARHITLSRNVLSGTFNAAIVVEGGTHCTFKDNVLGYGLYGVIGSSFSPGLPSINRYCGLNGWTWTGMTLVGSAQSNYPAGTTWVATESQAPAAAQIRAIVQQATAGVVKP